MEEQNIEIIEEECISLSDSDDEAEIKNARAQIASYSIKEIKTLLKSMLVVSPKGIGKNQLNDLAIDKLKSMKQYKLSQFIISIDVGLRNYCFSIFERNTRTLIDFELIDLFGPAIVNMKNILIPIRKIKSILRKFRKYQPYVMVAEEQYLDFQRGRIYQPSVIGSSLLSCLLALNDKLIQINPSVLESFIKNTVDCYKNIYSINKNINDTYKRKKQSHVDLVHHLFTVGEIVILPNILEKFNSQKKKDDVADAIIQGFCFDKSLKIANEHLK